MNDSLNMADFFFTRVNQTIAYKQYIRSVEIEYSYLESYGNEYISVCYTVEVRNNFKRLPFNEQEFVFKGSPNYTFSLSTARKWLSDEKKMLRLIEFKQIYDSLSAYVIMQLEKGLTPKTPIKVMGIDFWPRTNYAEEKLTKILHERNINLSSNRFESDIYQWEKLHQLAKQSEKIYKTEKKYFTLKDTTLNFPFGLDQTDLRYILIKYRVPINVKGIKTIDEVSIHTFRLVEALKKELEEDSFGRIKDKVFYQRLIIYLYEYYLPNEKEHIIDQQQKNFLRDFIVQKGDVVELIDNRIVMVNSVSVEKENIICFEYAIIKNNLQISKRTRTVSMETAAFVLKEEIFLQYPNGYIKSLSVLGKWMKKRKMKIVLPIFEPDLISL